MAEQENEHMRIARVKELEEMVKKLENENKQLLNKVKTNSPTLKHKKIAGELQKIQDEPSGVNKLKNMGNKMTRNDSLDDLENDILSLEEEGGAETQPDEWLFVSPKLPPTPVQKKVSPLQWLSEGHNRNRDTDLPSLSDVRKTLVFNMNEAENLIGASRVVPGGESPPLSPSMRSKQNPSNRTAQKYLEQVRQRRNSPPSFQFSHSPSGGSPTLEVRSVTGKNAVQMQQRNSDSAVPVVRWKAKAPSESPQALSDEEDEEEVSRVKWRVKQIPSDDNPAGGGGNGGGGTLKIRWNPAMAAGQYSSEEDETGGGMVQPQQQNRQQRGGGVANGVPVLKWKAKVPEESGSGARGVPIVNWKAKVPKETESEGGDVPIVRWKAKVPVESEPQSEDVPVIKWKAKTPVSNNGDVPVVKWKAKTPTSNNGDVPVVKWKVKVPVEPEPENEDVPVVKWKAKVPIEPESQQNEDIPVVRWKAQMPNSSGSPPSQKRGIASARGRGHGLAPPSRRAAAARDESENSEEGMLNGDSEQSGSEASVENLRVSRYTAHQSGLQKRSPPKAQHSGLAPPRQGGASHRNLSPSSRTSSNSNQASGASRSPSSSPGGGLRQPRKQLQAPSSSSSPGQRGSGGKPPSSGMGPRTQAQNSRAVASSQQQRTFGLKESRSSPSTSAPAPARGGLTPPSGQGKARRMLPTPPSAGGGNGGRATSSGGVQMKQSASQGIAPKRIVQQRAKPVSQQEVEPVAPGDDDDSWLEGCF